MSVPLSWQYNTMSRLCKDCGLFDMDAFPGFLTEADLYVLFVREARVIKEHVSPQLDRRQ